MISKKTIINTQAETYAAANTSRESKICKAITRATDEELQYANMLSGKVEGRLLAMLVAISGAKRVLELGTFTGYSAVTMAEALPDDGEVCTIEMNRKYSDIAERFFKQSAHGHKITLHFGTVRNILPEIQGAFDLIFLDADKDSYPDYYEMLLPKLSTGGLLVADNVLWYGGVLQPEDRKSKSLDRFNRMVTEDERVENVLLTVRDGIQIIRKIRD